jgi:hypothetical protein
MRLMTETCRQDKSKSRCANEIAQASFAGCVVVQINHESYSTLPKVDLLA